MNGASNVLVLLEGPLDRDRSDNDRLGLMAAAQALGHPTHVMDPAPDPSDPSTGLGAVEAGPHRWGLVFMNIPTPERYRRVWTELASANIHLLNDPAQHLAALELHRSIVQLEGLTARSEVVRGLDELPAALDRLPPPVFIKSTVQSRKWFGWKACVAQTRGEATGLVRKLLSLKHQAREVVLVRELLALRKTGQEMEGFPFAREYRLFVLDGEVVDLGYYWPFGDPFGPLTPADDEEVRRLARAVHTRLAVPWLCVDVGQLETGGWIVIETGDPTCSGLGTVRPHTLLERLMSRLARRTAG